MLDRAKLEAAAGDCYGVPEAEYARLIGLPLSASQGGLNGQQMVAPADAALDRAGAGSSRRRTYSEGRTSTR